MLNFLKKLLKLESSEEVKLEPLKPQHNVNSKPTYKKPKAPKNPLVKDQGGAENAPKMPKVKQSKKEEAAPKRRGRPPKAKS